MKALVLHPMNLPNQYVLCGMCGGRIYLEIIPYESEVLHCPECSTKYTVLWKPMEDGYYQYIYEDGRFGAYYKIEKGKLLLPSGLTEDGISCSSAALSISALAQSYREVEEDEVISGLFESFVVRVDTLFLWLTDAITEGRRKDALLQVERLKKAADFLFSRVD